ncbi:MAG: HU family DNA-binding protein [Geminicoccaceae bacterium]|nr:HU family DNA-binding protein [Geminicoccaceae bacterium]MCB9942251.1 HU family DNA-binding protein [Geminicoccaceae bacterium]
MTLDELNAAVAAATETSKATAAKSVQAVLTSIQDALGKGEKVSIAGFGIFEVSHRPARTGRNPQTGKSIEIAASNAVKFKPGKALRDSVNE